VSASSPPSIVSSPMSSGDGVITGSAFEAEVAVATKGCR
jgi:hypothetical protein